MGGAVSVGVEPTLNEAQKAELFTHMKGKYEEQCQELARRKSLNEVDLVKQLKLEYNLKAMQLTAPAAKTGGTAENTPEPEPPEACTLEGALDDAEALSTAVDFAAQMGLHSPSSPGVPSAGKSSDFRKRRLSVTAKTKAVAAPTDNRRSSKVMYRSQEIGAASPVPLPFSDTKCGTYSCHGVEPSYYEEEGVTAKINQDRGCVVYPFAEDPMQAVFAVFDGHGEHGDIVSHFAMNEMQSRLEQHPALANDPGRAMKETYLSVDKALTVSQGLEATFSGTTAVSVLMRGSHLFMANAGDSRAVLATQQADGSLKAKDLTIDQNPDSPLEQARILGKGGFVSPPPEPGLSARVWLDKDMTQIGLAMARSIGDHAVKLIGVIAEPEITEHELQPEDKFMILASDGVWEFISSQQAVDKVQANLSKGAMAATQALIEAAAARWREVEGDYRDDITAIVVLLPCLQQAA